VARNKKSYLANWQENWASLVLGAVIIIVVGLLIVNFINRNKNSQIDNGQKTDISNQESSSGNKYKVTAGDSLSKIAKDRYGDESYWPVLATANKVANPNIIYVDAELDVPSKSDADQMKAQMIQTSYKVQAGDTLFTIAVKMYGDGSKWTMISTANGLGRLPNGNPLVLADSTIRIPR